jgi:hypothetical protein
VVVDRGGHVSLTTIRVSLSMCVFVCVADKTMFTDDHETIEV